MENNTQYRVQSTLHLILWGWQARNKIRLKGAVPTFLYGSKTSIKKNKNVNKIQAAKM
jgi:hypothetical protein